jgi:16S rRNA (cytidine1402-2'-O)-methyltransferase
MGGKRYSHIYNGKYGAENHMSEKVQAGALYVVGTPIGNLSDFSPRAKEILSEVDFIAAEDTRVTLKLLNYFGIKKSLISYYEQNKYQKGDVICSRIEKGESCAVVSDAGMPLISDPGETLVAQCAEKNIPVYVVPGPSACVSALALSGLSTGRFTFEGFLSVNKRSRKNHLESLKNERRTMIFYEAPHKLVRTLKDFYHTFGDRRISIVKEMTKIHEQVERTTLSKAVKKYDQTLPRGEFVLVIEGLKEPEEKAYTLEDAVEIAKESISGGMSANEAAKMASADTGIKKSDIYRYIMSEKNKGE